MPIPKKSIINNSVFFIYLDIKDKSANLPFSLRITLIETVD